MKIWSELARNSQQRKRSETSADGEPCELLTSPLTDNLYSTIRSEKANARIVEWMEDSLAAAAAAAQTEGHTPSIATLSPTTLRTNSDSTQIMSKAFEVSATAEC